MNLKEFIEVTSICDGKKAVIRAACIDAVIDNLEECENYAVGPCIRKPPCRTIYYGGSTFDAIESYDEICDMIYNAEL